MSNLTTTITEVYNHRPCEDGFAKLIGNVLGIKTCGDINIAKQFNLLTDEQKNKKLTLLEILDSNGVKDAFWALLCWEYRDYCLLLADVAESVAYIFNEKYPNDNRVKDCIQGIRDYHAYKITLEELHELRAAIYAASSASAADDDDAAYAVTYAATYATAYTAAYAYADDTAGTAAQWEVNEKLMREFIEKDLNV